jgi:hypothetical protein
MAQLRMTGYYSSPELEQPFLETATALPKICGQGTGRGTLQVMTEAYDTGGHTALVVKILSELPSDEPGDVILTHQAVEDAPHRLKKAIADHGGCLLSLRDISGGWRRQLTKWRLLSPVFRFSRSWRADRAVLFSPQLFEEKAFFFRQLGNTYRRIILSTHMADPWAVAAFGHKDFQRPVFLLNHADHLFWLGRSVADAVLEFRDFGEDISRNYRGSPFTIYLPLLFEEGQTHGLPEKEELRMRLGLPEDRTIIITVSSSYKLRPINGLNMPVFIDRSLTELPEAFHLVIGSSAAESVWGTLQKKWSDRLRLVGPVPRPELDSWLRASDIYLSGFPLGGGCAILDAVKWSIPVLLLGTPAYYIGQMDERGWVSPDLPALFERLKTMVQSPNLAVSLGCEQFEAFRRYQGQAAWRSRFKEIMDWPDVHKVQANWQVSHRFAEIEEYFDCVLRREVNDDRLDWVLRARLRELRSRHLRCQAQAVVNRCEAVNTP